MSDKIGQPNLLPMLTVVHSQEELSVSSVSNRSLVQTGDTAPERNESWLPSPEDA